MENHQYEQRQTKLQEATRDLILKGNPNNFTTLTFKENVSFKYARECYGSFASGLKRELFGWKSRKRILMFPVVESTGDGMNRATHHDIFGGRIHIHSVMGLPGNPQDHKELVLNLWMQSGGLCGNPCVYCPNSDDWFLDFDDKQKRRVMANYAVKTCANDHAGVLWDFVPRWLTK